MDLMFQGAGSNLFSYLPKIYRDQLASRLKAGETALDRFLDAHFWPYELSKRGECSILSDWLHFSGLTCGTYDVPVYDRPDHTARQLEQLTGRYADLPWLTYVTKADDILRAKRSGAIAFHGVWQPVTPLPVSLSAIDEAFTRGLRCLMLTYNAADHVGVGCSSPVDGGLSIFGLELVRRCNDLGIVIDTSHCGHLTTLDACKRSKQPVTANHTSARAIFEHVRAKTDDEIKAIADTDGIIGIVTSPFLLTDGADATIDVMLDHIDHISKLVGSRHVAIGSDWPLQAPEDVLNDLFAPYATQANFGKQNECLAGRRLRGFDDYRDLMNITRGLVARGYGDSEVRGILGENALRVFRAVCG